jgi:hypothetical protein
VAQSPDGIGAAGAAPEAGLWKVCPKTIYDPYEAIATRR